MKLLISLSYYAPHISGLTLSVKRLAELLASHDDTITILTTQHDKKLPLKEKISNVSVIRVPYLFRVSKGFVMPSFFYPAYKAIIHADAVLIVLPQIEGVVVALLAKIMGKKIICLYICEATLSDSWMGKFISVCVKIVNRFILLFADEVTTLTDDFAQYNEVLQQRKNIHSIYPVVLPPKIEHTEKNILQDKFLHKKYHIGYLGRIAHEKGIEYLLNAIPILQMSLGNDFSIVLAGPKKTVGEEAYKKKIDELLQKYSEFIVPLGELGDDQLGAFYSLLDVFVLPSLNNTEAFGMVQVEAMYCGTPVVSTDLPGVRVPIMQTKMGEIIPPKNSEALAKAIVTIVGSKKNYTKTFSEIQQIFSVEEILKKYQQLLSSQ